MKIIKTLKLEDKGQDFLTLDIKENGIISGYSIMFSNDRLSLLGIGKLNGEIYYTFKELKEQNFKQKLVGLNIYLKDTKYPDPYPWNARTLKYKIIK